MLIATAILTIYIVLGVLYESYVHPLTILSTLPSAGVGALLCSYGSGFCTPSFVTSWIKTWATAGVITGNPVGTPNKLLWKGGL